jgi:methanol--5-hydroxybenzimidazolylcobamide Co-methyltransferase
MTQQVIKRHSTLAISDEKDLCFGFAPSPVTCGFGLVIGAGRVFPEVNFTLPTMSIEDATWDEVRNHYIEIGAMIVRAARRLRLEGLVVEFEHLPPMTENPDWGGEITRLLATALRDAYETNGLKSALRVTPVDLRDAVRPPQLRSGKMWDTMRRSFHVCASAGAHILSIESVGGKEVHDEAMMYGDIAGIIFSLGVLAPRDMQFLWDEIVNISGERGVVPGGDSACGFANTAMQLASQSMVPEVLAAVIRAASSVRSLVAIERGAVGPSKDCAYEGPILKAITGIPISMEGKSACCAHFSPVGNIAAAMCDLWSNESVQNVRLLSGYAPEAFLELLSYDCRIFNVALASGSAEVYKRLLIESDVHLSPQALVLSPSATLRIASAIVGEGSHYQRVVAAARTALSIVQEAVHEGWMSLAEPEQAWLSRIERGLQILPDREETLLANMVEAYGTKFDLHSYGL